MIREQLSFFPPFAVSLYDAPKNDNYRKMPRTGSRREAVLRQIIKAKKRGITDEELGTKLALTPEQIHRGRAELLEGGLIQDSTKRRKTTFGDDTIVWRVTDFGLSLWNESGRH